MRLLDIGCGWGGMVMHAAEHYGVHAVGVTVSQRQVDYGREAVAAAGLGDRVDIRFQDYRDITDGPFDAISSIGMVEHVGAAQLAEYFGRLYRLLRPGGRLLNHGIC
jgi:cyclopropane-fatty-acyl-phospholipid synthase